MMHASSRRWLADEGGMALVTVVLLTALVMALGTTAVIQTSTDLRISGNYRTGEGAFYAAEGGGEEARGRMRGSGDIKDSLPADPGWMAFIGEAAKAEARGYDSANTKHFLTPSLLEAEDSDFTVTIAKAITDAGLIVTTPQGRIVYVVRSFGESLNASRVVEARITSAAPIDAPAALYVKAPTTIQGTSTNVIGEDQCGGSTVPGIMTTLNANTVTKNGNPKVCGANAPCGTGTPWDVVGDGDDIDVQAIVNQFKGDANYAYNVTAATHTTMSWGSPTMGATLQDASSCDARNVVYYDTNDTYIKLAGGTSGCGLLLVDGDLEVNGGFQWYGMVIVSGSVTYLGGGNKNITGAVMAGSEVDIDLVGGNSNIVYCSEAINGETANMPWRVLSWREVY